MVARTLKNVRAKKITFCLLGMGLLTGCANPGPPRPPSLHLPRPVKNLVAKRQGNAVLLQWTAPSDTTDGELLSPSASQAGHVAAKGKTPSSSASALPVRLVTEICRTPVPAQADSACLQVQRISVEPGSVVTVPMRLSPDLLAGAPRVIAYRVRTFNAKGRSAAPSSPALAVAGEAPEALQNLHVRPVRQGAELSWTKEEHPIAGEVVLLERNELPENVDPHHHHTIQLRVQSSPDPGGTVDPVVLSKQQYRYQAARVRKVEINGEVLELCSATVTADSGSLQQVYPPQPPKELAAVATPSMGTQQAAIDLSWEPNTEPDVAGYNVYRAEGNAETFVRLTLTPIAETSFHDTIVVSQKTYRYYVTAVDTSGNESRHSLTATENVP